VKAGIFGLNAAQLFGIDPTAVRCGLTADPLTSNIDETAMLARDGAILSPWTPNGPTTRRQVLHWLASATTQWAPM
jgi:hypothetical protein